MGRDGSKTLPTAFRCWEKTPPYTSRTQERGPLLSIHERLVGLFSTLGPRWSQLDTRPRTCDRQAPAWEAPTLSTGMQGGRGRVGWSWEAFWGALTTSHPRPHQPLPSPLWWVQELCAYWLWFGFPVKLETQLSHFWTVTFLKYLWKILLVPHC